MLRRTEELAVIFSPLRKVNVTCADEICAFGTESTTWFAPDFATTVNSIP
jgi:hypothetical protein